MTARNSSLVICKENEKKHHNHQLQKCDNLIAPSADFWLVEVIDEDGHGLADGRPIGGAHPLVHRSLDGLLEDLRGRGRREVALLVEPLLGVVTTGERVEDACLG